MTTSIDQLKTMGLLWPGGPIGVILVHGLTGTPTELSGIAKDLNAYGFTVFCPLLAGHCVSEAELLQTTWADWSKSVEEAFFAFSEHADVIFAGGISAGAVLSLRLAQIFPGRIRALSLYSTTLWWDGWSIPRLSFLLPLVLRLPYIGKRYRFEEAWPYGIKNKRLRERVHAQMISGDPAAAGFAGTPGRSLRELWRLVDQVKVNLPQIKSPTLLIHARDDDIASIRNAIYIKEHIRGPSRLIALEDSYHMITIDQERRQVGMETARYFVEQLSRQEKEKLAQHERKPGQLQTLLEAAEYRERPPQELLQGLSKRRNWL
jgi:carboxylesterase